MAILILKNIHNDNYTEEKKKSFLKIVKATFWA